jgi:hypothetical protein
MTGAPLARGERFYFGTGPGFAGPARRTAEEAQQDIRDRGFDTSYMITRGRYGVMFDSDKRLQVEISFDPDYAPQVVPVTGPLPSLNPPASSLIETKFDPDTGLPLPPA